MSARAWADADVLDREFRSQVQRKLSQSTIPHVLDYGCGNPGLSRSLWSGILSKLGGRLSLYDPELPKDAAIFSPYNRFTNILERNELSTLACSQSVNIVSLCYTLCYMDPKERCQLLQLLRDLFPDAELIVADYTVQTREQAEVLHVCPTGSERRWKETMGEEDYLRTHLRFPTFWHLTNAVREGCWDVMKGKPLPSGVRSLLTAKANVQGPPAQIAIETVGTSEEEDLLNVPY